MIWAVFPLSVLIGANVTWPMLPTLTEGLSPRWTLMLAVLVGNHFVTEAPTAST